MKMNKSSNSYVKGNCFFLLLGFLKVILLAPFLVGPLNANAEVICPPLESYAPCGCSEDYATGDGTTVELSCSFEFLGDVRVSEILDVFLTTPSISPVSSLRLARNLLTRVPLQISQFKHLENVLLDNNFILSIPNNAFNFTRPPRYLWLNSNRLNAFEAGAFQGNYAKNLSAIFLYDNELTRFKSDVFQSVMEHMMEFNGHPYQFIRLDQNPIDCESDPCHLAWLIRDNRNLLPAVYLGQCSNGTTFEDLDPNGYNDCPVLVTDTTPSSILSTPSSSGRPSIKWLSHYSILIIFLVASVTVIHPYYI